MLTVLLSTRNRARILRTVLDGFQQIQPPVGGWKLIVVNNGSTDETVDVIDHFSSVLPLQSTEETTLGKNAALNTGLKFIDGDLTVFTDDDVFPHEDWLVQLRNAADTHPDYTIFSGPVAPRWEVPPPRWVEWIDPGPTFTVTPSSVMEGELLGSDITWVFGPNMAIRTSVFQSGIRFDTSIGPRGSSYPMGSETELVSRLSGMGHRAWYAKRAVVEHFVRKEQLKRDWILKRAIRYGRGNLRLNPDMKSWAGIPRHCFRDIPKEGLRTALAWATFRPRALLLSRWRFNFLLGKAVESRIMARERSTVHSIPEAADTNS